MSGRDDALREAVLERNGERVRELLAQGANALAGHYPIEEISTPVAIARERGYADLVAILEAEMPAPQRSKDRSDELRQAFRRGEEAEVLAILAAQPELVHYRDPDTALTPLHVAAARGMEQAVRWLIDHGADSAAESKNRETALELAASQPIAELLAHFCEGTTARFAVSEGNTAWLAGQLVRGELGTPQDDRGWLLRVAVDHGRADILAMLLEAGLDPDARVELAEENSQRVFTWGMPLYECVRRRDHAMAALLLAKGADANGQVYASGTPLSEAFGQRDEEMIALLIEHGGKPNPSMAGLYRRKDLAERLLAEHGDARLPDDGFSSGTVAEQLIGGAAKGGDPEILAIGIARVDWPHGDRRWHQALTAPFGFWNHWIGPWCHLEWDRTGYLTCLKLLLERSGPPNERLRHGLTALHGVVLMGNHVWPEERAAFAETLLAAGARTDPRDPFLGSTPLGWACRWGREELVRTLIEKGGADPVEADAEPWARPLAWAERKGHATIAAYLRSRT